METQDQYNQEGQENANGNINENEEGQSLSDYEPGDDEANQDDYPQAETDNGTGTGDLDPTGGNTDNNDVLDNDASTTDSSANDVDGNGGYPDNANAVETDS